MPAEEYADTQYLIRAVAAYLPTNTDHLEPYWQAQRADEVCSRVIDFCKTSWPDECAVSCDLQPYWKDRGQFSLCGDLLLHDGRIAIPKALQEDSPRPSRDTKVMAEGAGLCLVARSDEENGAVCDTATYTEVNVISNQKDMVN